MCNMSNIQQGWTCLWQSKFLHQIVSTHIHSLEPNIYLHLPSTFFMKSWIIIFGAPEVFSNNGERIIGDSFTGICEKKSTLKLKLWDYVSITNQDIGKGSDYSISLSKILINNNRFSPSQLIFRYNTNIQTWYVMHYHYKRNHLYQTLLCIYLRCILLGKYSFSPNLQIKWNLMEFYII